MWSSIIYLLFLVLVGVHSQQSLRVTVFPQEPIFIVDQNGTFTGIGYDILLGVFQVMQERYNTTFTPQFSFTTSIEGVLQAVDSNQADIGLSGVVPPPGLSEFARTSVAYYDTVLQAMSLVSFTLTTFELIWAILESAIFLQLLLMLIIYSIVMAHIIWLFERRRKGDFSRDYDAGVAQGVYWSWVSISTIGFGDAAPKTTAGRAFTTIAVVGAIVIMALFTGVITSTLTEKVIEPPPLTRNDFALSDVAVVSASYSLWFARAVNPRILIVDNVTEGLQAVKENKVTYFLGEQATLVIYNYTERSLSFAGPSFDNMAYEFIYSDSLSDDLVSNIDKAIYLFKASKNYTSIVRKYYEISLNGTKPANTDSEFQRVWLPDVILVTVLGSFCVFFCTLAIILFFVRKHKSGKGRHQKGSTLTEMYSNSNRNQASNDDEQENDNESESKTEDNEGSGNP